MNTLICIGTHNLGSSVPYYLSYDLSLACHLFHRLERFLNYHSKKLDRIFAQILRHTPLLMTSHPVDDLCQSEVGAVWKHMLKS